MHVADENIEWKSNAQPKSGAEGGTPLCSLSPSHQAIFHVAMFKFGNKVNMLCTHINQCVDLNIS